jgi:methylthioribulose-1-phosphate dehydratase
VESTLGPDTSVARRLVEAVRRLERRGWALGTSGNFSAVVANDPLRLAITASGVDKASLSERDIVEVDGDARLVSGHGRPSAEAHLHVAVVKTRGAGAVLHTHSVWSTVLTNATESGEISIRGYEMLKGLAGVTTHEHEESVPILENAQDMPKLARDAEAILTGRPGAHAFLLRRHGLYTWGRDLPEAMRHVEILEFLFEVVGRSRGRD